MANKMTYTMALEIAIASVEATDVKEKLEALKTSIAKKNSSDRKPTAQQKENADLKTKILEGMESGRGYTITDLIKSIKALDGLTNQRVSAIVRQMVESGTVRRDEVKRKAYFTKVEVED